MSLTEKFKRYLPEENPLSHTYSPFLPIHAASSFYHEQQHTSFCSYDFLGLSEHPEVKKNAMKYLLQYGVAPLSVNFHGCHIAQKLLEEKWEQTLNRSVLFFSSSSWMHQKILSSLAASNSCFFIDEACHEDLWKAALQSGAHVQYFNHANISQLKQLLQQSTGFHGLKLIITESLFTSTGELSDFRALEKLCEETQSVLYVDDSNMLGIFGKDGWGQSTLLKSPHFIVGSFQHACGSSGSFLFCDEIFKEACLKHFDSTANLQLSPPQLGALDTVLDLIPSFEGERKELHQRAHFLRKQLLQLGYPIKASTSPIIALPCDNHAECLELRQRLLEARLLVGYANYFSEGESRCFLSIILNHLHTTEHIHALLHELKASQESAVLLG